MNQKRIEVYTDGSCLKNPGGRGGWAVIFDDGRQISGGEISTTNNRMELTAVIEALKAANPNEKLTLYTDSSYVKNGITSWIKNWKLNNWKTAAKTPVLNQDLWQELDKLANKIDVKFEWVQGHSGNPMNEDCDYLAKQRANDSDQSIKKLNFPAEIKSVKSDANKKSICAEKFIDSVTLTCKSGEKFTITAEYLRHLIADNIHETKILSTTPCGLKLISHQIPNYFAIEIVKHDAIKSFLLGCQIDSVSVNYSDNSTEIFLMAWSSPNDDVNKFQTIKYKNGIFVIEVDGTLRRLRTE